MYGIGINYGIGKNMVLVKCMVLVKVMVLVKCMVLLKYMVLVKVIDLVKVSYWLLGRFLGFFIYKIWGIGNSCGFEKNYGIGTVCSI